MAPETQTQENRVEYTLTLQGALSVADSVPADFGDMRVIALKVLAHEYRKTRVEADRLAGLAMARGENRWTPVP